jgi:hypothetical protein
VGVVVVVAGVVVAIVVGKVVVVVGVAVDIVVGEVLALPLCANVPAATVSITVVLDETARPCLMAEYLQ